MFKSDDQQSADIIGRVIDRSHDFIAAFLSQPIGRSLKERGGDVAIVNALEEAKTADIRLMERIVVRIIARHDSPNNLAPATAGPGQK